MSDAINIATPVEPLGYAQERDDPWVMIIRGVSGFTIVMCAANLFAITAQIVAAFSGGYVTWRFPRMVSLEGLFLAIELASGAAAGALLAGAIGARTLRPWSRALIFWSALAALVLAAMRMFVTLAKVFFSGTAFPNRRLVMTMWIAQSIGMMVVTMSLPMLIVWLMGRSEVRRRFEGQVGS